MHGICSRGVRLPFPSSVWMVRTVCVQFYTVRWQPLRQALKCQGKMAAQTARMESQEAMFAALEDLKAAGGSVALARVSKAPGMETLVALELLVASGHAEVVIAALDAAKSSAGQQLIDEILDQPCEPNDRAAAAEQLLRKAPTL